MLSHVCWCICKCIVNITIACSIHDIHIMTKNIAMHQYTSVSLQAYKRHRETNTQDFRSVYFNLFLVILPKFRSLFYTTVIPYKPLHGTQLPSCGFITTLYFSKHIIICFGYTVCFYLDWNLIAFSASPQIKRLKSGNLECWTYRHKADLCNWHYLPQVAKAKGDSSLDSEDDYHSGSRNVSHQQQSF